MAGETWTVTNSDLKLEAIRCAVELQIAHVAAGNKELNAIDLVDTAARIYSFLSKGPYQYTAK